MISNYFSDCLEDNSGEEPHVRWQLDIMGSPTLPYAAAIADLPFAIAAAVSPALLSRVPPARKTSTPRRSPTVLTIPVARMALTPHVQKQDGGLCCHMMKKLIFSGKARFFSVKTIKFIHSSSFTKGSHNINSAITF